MYRKASGFTLVELVVVMAVIGILAGIVIVGYSSWHSRTVTNTMKNDLQNVATAMKNAKNFSNGYPTTFPSTFTPSSGDVLQFASTSSSAYCVNIYNASEPTIFLSYDSQNGLQNYLCGGATTGSAIGGTVPTAPRGVNLASDFSNWALTGTASYNQSSGVVTFGANGTVTSPVIRVDTPTSITAGGDMYATKASANASLSPNGGFHMGIYYYASDGTTLVNNSANYTSNGCAKSFTLGSWNAAKQPCAFSGGPNVIYVKVVYYSAASGYASSDLQMKNPLVTGN